MIFAFESVMIYEFTLDIPFACPFICVFLIMFCGDIILVQGREVAVLWVFHIKNVVFKTRLLNLLNERKDFKIVDLFCNYVFICTLIIQLLVIY
ncbi:hypothetical protein Hdeb2414_s0023g00638271 [Helianthus debilis subsp. tardiflorus]